MATSTPKSKAEKAEKAAKPAKANKPGRATNVARSEARSAAAASAKAEGQGEAKAAPATPSISLRNLVDTVAAATGQKKPDAKKAVEAVLAAIGAGLAAGSSLNVPPLGKVRVAKAKGSVLTLKLRLADASRAAGLALAEDEEDS